MEIGLNKFSSYAVCWGGMYGTVVSRSTSRELPEALAGACRLAQSGEQYSLWGAEPGGNHTRIMVFGGPWVIRFDTTPEVRNVD